MLKKIYTNIGDYYFDSEKFTLSTSSVEGTTSYKPPYIPKNVLQKIVINISNSCNLSCSYCYADGGNYGMDNKIMTLDTADNIINEVKFRGITQINRLILFGGEPFLNTQLFEYIIKEFSKFTTILKIETVTNGTVLNNNVKKMHF